MLKNLDKIPSGVRETVESLFDRALTAFPRKIDSIYLYGSVVTDDFIPEQSDINSLVLFDSFGSAEINILRPIIRDSLKKRITAPLCLAVETFERSGDVFPLEFIEIQDKHLMLYGDKNQVECLEIRREHLRIKIEEQIKGKLIRMRELLLEHQGADKILVDILIEVQRQLFPVFRNLLRFLGMENPPATKNDILHELEERNNFTVMPCQKVWQHISGKSSIGRNSLSVYNEYIDVLLKLAQVIDRMESK